MRALLLATIVAALTPTLGAQTDVVPWEELPRATRQKIERAAEHAILINGELWTTEIADRAKSIIERELKRAAMRPSSVSATSGPPRSVEPYVGTHIPRYASLERDVSEGTLKAAVESRGLFWVNDAILQKLDDGFLFTNFFLTGYEGPEVDGMMVETVAKIVGDYAYIDARGARRTVKKLQAAPDLLRSVSAQELAQLLQERDVDSLPSFVFQRSAVPRDFTGHVFYADSGARYYYEWRRVAVKLKWVDEPPAHAATATDIE